MAINRKTRFRFVICPTRLVVDPRHILCGGITENKNLAGLKEMLGHSKRDKEGRKGYGILGREELIALCAAHILSELFVSKVGSASSHSAWDAVKAAAEIVDYNIT